MFAGCLIVVFGVYLCLFAICCVWLVCGRVLVCVACWCYGCVGWYDCVLFVCVVRVVLCLLALVYSVLLLGWWSLLVICDYAFVVFAYCFCFWIVIGFADWFLDWMFNSVALFLYIFLFGCCSSWLVTVCVRLLYFVFSCLIVIVCLLVVGLFMLLMGWFRLWLIRCFDLPMVCFCYALGFCWLRFGCLLGLGIWLVGWVLLVLP